MGETVVYIATSLDGYIADAAGSVDFLDTGKTEETEDHGFAEFIEEMDALVMGRLTFETVLGFADWPYDLPVFVLSRTLDYLPDHLHGKAEIIEGTPSEVVHSLNDRGFDRLYIDGGQTIQSFLEDDLIDRMILTRAPVLLGGGTPLFAGLSDPLAFRHIETTVTAGRLVTSEYERGRR